MNISSKDISRSFRDFNNIIDDLIHTDRENYVNLVKRFVLFINNDKIVAQIVEPLINYNLKPDKYLIRHTESRSELIVPVNIEEHIAFVLQLFSNVIIKDGFDLVSYLNKYVITTFDDLLNKFNRNIIDPALRELLIKIEDFINDEINEDREYELTDINIFNIESINNQSGNIAIGKNIQIQQGHDVNQLPEEFAKALLENGYSLKEVYALREDIEELKELLMQQKPDNTKIRNIFKKVASVTGDLMIGVLANIISRPDITSAIISSL